MFRGLLLLVVASALTAVPAAAHYEPEILGHHWAVARYGSELRFQMLAMLLIAALLCTARLLRHAYCARRKSTR